MGKHLQMSQNFPLWNLIHFTVMTTQITAKDKLWNNTQEYWFIFLGTSFVIVRYDIVQGSRIAPWFEKL